VASPLTTTASSPGTTLTCSGSQNVSSTDAEARLNAILRELALDPLPHSWAERTMLCEEALALLPRNVAPEHWAAVQSELGTAYLNRFDGDRAESLERALEAFERARP